MNTIQNLAHNILAKLARARNKKHNLATSSCLFLIFLSACTIRAMDHYQWHEEKVGHERIVRGVKEAMNPIEEATRAEEAKKEAARRDKEAIEAKILETENEALKQVAKISEALDEYNQERKSRTK